MENYENSSFIDYINSIGYIIETNKGQRVMRPRDETFLTDPAYDEQKNHEIYISNLPNDLYADELLPFLCRVGPVLQIRLIMTFVGRTKGAAYVVFENVQDAFRAIDELDCELIRKGCLKRVCVRFSVNNNRLVVKNIDKNLANEEVMSQLTTRLSGIKSIKFNTELQQDGGGNDDATKSAVVIFHNHQLAATARRLLVPGMIKLGSRTLTADWGKPKNVHCKKWV